jgi:hypothetical protein
MEGSRTCSTAALHSLNEFASSLKINSSSIICGEKNLNFILPAVTYTNVRLFSAEK